MSGLEFLPLVAIVLLFWLFFIRPAARRQKETLRMQGALGVGDEIVLTSGIYGTITELDDDRLFLEVAPGTTIAVDRRAVGAVARQDAPDGTDENANDPLTDNLTDDESSHTTDVEES